MVEGRGPGAARRRTAIIDIGSNSVRLVVYDGPARLPAVLFNEKVMAGLGRGLDRNGAIAAEAMEAALGALGRFSRLLDSLEPDEILAVATAAVRDASNGAELVDRARAMGLPVAILSGAQEAEMAALGVLSAIPDADGLAGDLGGGSLELVRIGGGRVGQGLSLPMGVLRVDPDRQSAARELKRRLAGADWVREGRGRPFYMVGGSWRALARLALHRQNDPLTILHAYRMAPDEPRRLLAEMGGLDAKALKQVPDLSSARAQTLPRAAALLAALVEELQPSELIVSSYGVREGLLYAMLSDEERAVDPLVAAARDEGATGGRFPEHGDLIERWIAPLFPDDAPAMRRLRHVACLLADVGWRANPDFRGARAREVALHGNWVGIDARGRALVTQALETSLDAANGTDPTLATLAPAADLDRAAAWGLAIRLAQRLSAGTAAPLKRSALAVDGGRLTLALVGKDRPLYADSVARRHAKLATCLGLQPALVSRT